MTACTSDGAPRIDPSATVRDSSIGAWCDVGAGVEMTDTVLGDYSYLCDGASTMHADIGRFCSIAARVRVNPGNHPLDRVALHHFTYRSASYDLGADETAFFDWRARHRVHVGDDVWIGHGAVILPGVSIGTGAAVGAGAVVSRDVAAFTVVAGVPATTVRVRFPPDLQEGLLRISWWNWPRDRLRTALDDFRLLSARAFVDKYARLSSKDGVDTKA